MTFTAAVLLTGSTDATLIGAERNNTNIYTHFKCILYNDHDFKISRISVIDVLLDTASSGPMMVYALTLNVTTVLRGYGDHLCMLCGCMMCCCGDTIGRTP